MNISARTATKRPVDAEVADVIRWVAQGPSSVLLLICAVLMCLETNSFAAQFGDFTYTDQGESITITDYPVSSVGAVIIPETIDGKPVTRIGDSAFTDRTQITSITIPSTVTHLGVTSFELCRSIVSVTIPDGVVSIGLDCFYGCQSLVSVTIPDSVTDLGIRIFAGCRSLETVKLPDGLVVIPDSIFTGCYKLEGVTIPPTVQTIGASAFTGCYGLLAMTIPEGVTSVGDNAFTGCNGLGSIILPASMSRIGYFAFSSCLGLKSITILSGTTNVGTSAFSKCADLTTINLPPTLGTIGEKVFSECNGLTELVLPVALAEKGSSTFSNCSGLTHVWIPAGVTRLAGFIFAYCQALESATFLGNASALGNAAFAVTSPDFTIYFQPGASGFTTPSWSGYPTEMLDPEIDVRVAGGSVLADSGSPQIFENVIVGQSYAREWTITNIGNTSLAGLLVTQTGANPADFLVSDLDKTSLEPGENVILHIVFTPTELGSRSCILHLASNDTDENPFDIALSGDAAKPPEPKITVSPTGGRPFVPGKSTISFGTVRIGKKSSAKIFTIKNSGSAPLTGLAIELNGANSKEFTLQSSIKTSLIAGGSMPFKISFKPTAKSSRSAWLHVRSNDPKIASFDVKLAGFGAQTAK